MNCPVCGKKLPDLPEGWSRDMYFTMDCPFCKGLILVEDNQVFNFHKKLHEECPEWPEDGSNTGVLELTCRE